MTDRRQTRSAVILGWLRSYTVPLILLLTLGHQFGAVAVTDTAPIAHAPPDGYQSVTDKTRLLWAENGLKGPFRVEVILDGGDYEHPVYKKEVSGVTVVLPRLDPGRIFRWRVIHVDSGVMSREHWFKTPDLHVNY